MKRNLFRSARSSNRKPTVMAKLTVTFAVVIAPVDASTATNLGVVQPLSQAGSKKNNNLLSLRFLKICGCMFYYRVVPASPRLKSVIAAPGEAILPVSLNSKRCAFGLTIPSIFTLASSIFSGIWWINTSVPTFLDDA